MSVISRCIHPAPAPRPENRSETDTQAAVTVCNRISIRIESSYIGFHVQCPQLDTPGCRYNSLPLHARRWRCINKQISNVLTSATGGYGSNPRAHYRCCDPFCRKRLDDHLGRPGRHDIHEVDAGSSRSVQKKNGSVSAGVFTEWSSTMAS